MNKNEVSKKWFTETDVKHFKSRTLRTITNITRSMVNFIDTEQLSKMQYSLQLFLKDFADEFRTTNLNPNLGREGGGVGVGVIPPVGFPLMTQKWKNCNPGLLPHSVTFH